MVGGFSLTALNEATPGPDLPPRDRKPRRQPEGCGCAGPGAGLGQSRAVPDRIAPEEQKIARQAPPA